MAGKTSQHREALERQNAAIMAVFERAGFDQIAPDIIQPADIFLERSGEDIRARTFVFNDPAGNELCLRPDLTVPACRYHLSHTKMPEAETKYCYLGPAFRFPDELLSPQEFTQAGLEWFGDKADIAAEARVIKLAVSALEAAGLTGLKVSLGDLGLFNALLEDIAMPERWRRRLRHQFWRPQAFRNLLDTFAKPAGTRRSSISGNIDVISGKDAAQETAQLLAKQNLTLVTQRSVEDIAARLAEKLADRSEQPLAKADLAYANLNGVFLRAADQQEADLTGALLVDADLHEVDLRDAILTAADLTQSSLRGADLRGATLMGANLTNVDLSLADLRGAKLDETTLLAPSRRQVWTIANEGAAGKALDQIDLSWANLQEISFAGASLRESNFTRALLMGSDFTNADLRKADMSYADLTRANLRSADLTGATLTGANLDGARLEDATLDHVIGLNSE